MESILTVASDYLGFAILSVCQIFKVEGALCWYGPGSKAQYNIRQYETVIGVLLTMKMI